MAPERSNRDNVTPTGRQTDRSPPDGVPQADGSIKPEPVMDPVHVATSVLYMANLPLGANVQFMTVMATAMPYIGRG